MIDKLNFITAYGSRTEFLECLNEYLKPHIKILNYKYGKFDIHKITDKQFLYVLKLLKLEFVTELAHPSFEAYFSLNTPFSFDHFKMLDGKFAPRVHTQTHTANLLFSKITKHVKGQDSAVMDIISAWELHNLTLDHSKVDKTTTLIQGGTGCGKTFILKQLAKQCRVPFIHFDASTLTAEGYVGASVEDIMYQLSKKVKSNTSKAIVLLDEIDKICITDSNNDVGTFGAQKALLTLLEANEYEFKINNRQQPPAFSNMKGILFLMAGSFSQFTESKTVKKNPIGFGGTVETEDHTFTHESLIQAGLIPELAGRIGQLITLNPMTTEIFDEIIENPISGLRIKYLTLMSEIGGKFTLPNKKEIIKEALTLNLGVRGLNTLVQKEFTKQFNARLFS